MKFDIILKDLDDRDLETIEREGTIRIPESVTEIGENAFWGLEYLTHIKIPNRVKIIDRNAFYCCYNLEKVYLPESLRIISFDAFKGCESLKEVYIPEKIFNKVMSQIEFSDKTEVKEIKNLPQEPNYKQNDDKKDLCK